MILIILAKNVPKSAGKILNYSKTFFFTQRTQKKTRTHTHIRAWTGVKAVECDYYYSIFRDVRDMQMNNNSTKLYFENL